MTRTFSGCDCGTNMYPLKYLRGLAKRKKKTNELQ